MVGAATLGVALSPGTLVFYSLGIFIGPVSAEFGWDRAQISLVATLMTLALVFAIPVVGALIDRHGVRRVLLPSLFILGAGLNSFHMVHALWQFYACFIFIGAAAAGANSLAYIRSLCTWFDKERGLVIGIASSGMGIGLILIPPFAQALIEVGNWRVAYAGLGFVVWLIGIPVVYLLVHDRPGSRRGAGERQSGSLTATDTAELPGFSAAETLKSRRFWYIVLTFCMLAGAVNSVAVHFVPMLMDRGASIEFATTAASSFGAAIVMGRLATGVLIDRCFAPYVAAVFFFGAAAASTLLAAGASGTIGLLASVLIGLCVGAEGDVLAYLLSRYFGLRAFGTVYGYAFSAYLIGSSILPYLMGLGFELTHAYTIPLFICAGLTLTSAALVMRLTAFPKWEYKQMAGDHARTG